MKKYSTIFCTWSQTCIFSLCTHTAGEDREGDDSDDEEYANAEPTQAYNFDTGAEDQEDGEPMDCDATVAYNVGGEQQ